MSLLLKAAAVWGLMVMAHLAVAQTVRLSGTVRSGIAYRHSIGRRLLLVVNTEEIRVRRASTEGELDNFARCVTTPVHGPNDLDFLAVDFDPARKARRRFHFVLNAADDKAECRELERVINPNARVNHWYSHPMGTGDVILS